MKTLPGGESEPRWVRAFVAGPSAPLDGLSPRRGRLAAVAMGRVANMHRELLDAAERYADEAYGTDNLPSLQHLRERLYPPVLYQAGGRATPVDAVRFLTHLASGDIAGMRARPHSTLRLLTRAAVLSGGHPRDLFRAAACVAGPRKPKVIPSAWRTTTVTDLAETIYDGRLWDRMPILADALEDAGCDDAGVLTHCRVMSRYTARGDWVVDRILRKG